MNQESDSASAPPQVTGRRIKIEACGDFWKGSIKPKIRLTGRWLERAGFPAGQQVEVTLISPGLLELRSSSTGGA